MTREALIKICTMRIDGYTYQEIADEMGCTKQNVQQTIKDITDSRKNRFFSHSVYPNLIREIRIKHHSITEFSRISGIDYRRLQGLLTGKVKVSITEAITICKLFDKDVAYLFERKEVTT